MTIDWPEVGKQSKPELWGREGGEKKPKFTK